MDVIAGTLIAVERWYGVGDFVRIEPAQVTGIVEQFGFRTTVIRSLNRDRTYVRTRRSSLRRGARAATGGTRSSS
jgi:small-conductance mechanosensitive channel